MAKPRRVTDATRAASGGRPAQRTRHIGRRIVLGVLITVVSLGLIGTGLVAYAYGTTKLPDPNTDFKTNTSFVYYADGKTQVGSFQVQNRTTIPYEQMPQYVKDAVVAAENRTFWTDPGISVPGLMRAALGLVGIQQADNTATGGGSTITQQFIKIMFLTQERSFSRKFTELLLAAKIGQTMTKEQILEGYLNTVYFGRGAYGIEAAAQAYFHKTAAKLTLAESVALGAILNSPGNLDPANGDKQAADLLQRYQYTLNGMVEMGKITEDQKNKVYYQLPKFAKVNDDSRLGGQKGFLLALVKNELLGQGFSEEQIEGGGLKIVTTFDKADSDAAVEAAESNTLATVNGNKKKAKGLHAAIASVDNATGGVLAIYGGPDYVKSQRNWATTQRQTGSSFKPYALTAALREGWTLGDTLNGNRTVTPNGTISNPEGNMGQITLLKATTLSVNTAFYDLVRRMDGGAPAVITAANDAGVPTAAGWESSGDRIALGNPEVSPIDQASGYSTFANYGVHRNWHVVAKVTDSAGKQLYVPDTTGTQTIEHEVTQDVNYALEHVTQSGTGHVAGGLGYPVAGKTGTKGQPSRDKRVRSRETVAAWFVGYTAQVTTAVMYVGGADGNQPLENYNPSFFGGGPPARTWLDYMRTAMKGKDRVNFEAPTKRQSTQSPKPSPSSSAPTPSVSPSAPPASSVPPPATSAPPESSAPPASSAPPESSAPAAPSPSASQ